MIFITHVSRTEAESLLDNKHNLKNASEDEINRLLDGISSETDTYIFDPTYDMLDALLSVSDKEIEKHIDNLKKDGVLKWADHI